MNGEAEVTAAYRAAARRAKLVAVLICAGGGRLLAGQDEQSSLLAEYVSPSVLATNRSAASVDARASARDDPMVGSLQISFAPRRLTAGEKWEKFETEFGLQDRNSRGVTSAAESAKYRLDRAVYAADQFLQSVEDALRFDYGLAELAGGTRPADESARLSGNVLRDAVENMRFKSDVDLSLSGGAFVGMKLEMPFGD
jgi:hypothetical protein